MSGPSSRPRVHRSTTTRGGSRRTDPLDMRESPVVGYHRSLETPSLSMQLSGPPVYARGPASFLGMISVRLQPRDADPAIAAELVSGSLVIGRQGAAPVSPYVPAHWPSRLGGGQAGQDSRLVFRPSWRRGRWLVGAPASGTQFGCHPFLPTARPGGRGRRSRFAGALRAHALIVARCTVHRHTAVLAKVTRSEARETAV